MADNQQKTLQDFFLEEKEKLDAVERQRAHLKAPANDDIPTMRPDHDIIDRSLGPELNDDQIRNKAQNKAWSKYKQQQAKIEYRKEVEAKNKEREERMKKAFEEKEKAQKTDKAKSTKKPAKEQNNKKAQPKKAKDWAKEETKKKQEAEKAEQKKKSDRDKGMEL